MSQSVSEQADLGMAYTFIVRLRCEPGSSVWRGQIVDVRSGSSTTIVGAVTDNGMFAPFAAALAAALERLVTQQ